MKPEPARQLVTNSAGSVGETTATTMPANSAAAPTSIGSAHADAVDQAAHGDRKRHRQEREQRQQDAHGERRRLQVEGQQR